MRIGPLDRRCSLLKSESVQRPGAGSTETWVKVGDIWAGIAIPTGRTLPVADRLSAEVTAEIQVRFRKTIVAGMRIAHGDETYLIEAALPALKRTMLRLLCSNVVNP
jgi:SPP1 family predicted phage head-tail adaptor